MAAKGAESKEKIVQKILDTFEGAFPYEKEIRIPMNENGEDIEIKVTLVEPNSIERFTGKAKRVLDLRVS
jgi:phenylacetate-coenzyme A ligase PaaK-like adenylate-forming protein